MFNRLLILFLISASFCAENLFAQRQYASNSVLAKGDWYKIAITKEGVYKIDLAFLSKLGINVSSLNSASIQLFGNGGAMIAEKNNTERPDDLIENAIEVVDGGDGIFNGTDYVIFYAPGPHRWFKDSINKRFIHQQNLVNDTCFYFLTIGSNGKRIHLQNSAGVPNQQVSSFNERYHYETESTNLLNSGKNWYGESFSTSNLSRSFSVSFSDLDLHTTIQLRSCFLGRCIGKAGQMEVLVNGQPATPVDIVPVSGNLLDAYATSVVGQSEVISNSALLNINYTFSAPTIASQAWLDWFEIQGRRALTMPKENQLGFRDWASVGPKNVVEFTINHSIASTEIWDVSNPLVPEKMKLNLAGSQAKFINDASALKEYFAFNGNALAAPTALGKITNQDLHHNGLVDYLIIAPDIFLPEAQRLALFHQKQYPHTVAAISAEQVYNEFGGGNKSPVAIRDFIKMYYDRAAGDATKKPKYVLLFGAGAFDLKNSALSKANFIPCFESDNSIDPLATYTTDDFFALLADNDDINSMAQPDQLALAVGRIPATTITEAKTAVDKIIHYHAKESMGDWRNNLLLVADDKEANTFLNATEQLSKVSTFSNYLLNPTKIYVDAFPLQTIYGTSTAPAVNRAILDQMFAGNLIVNYSGHGNFQQLSGYSIFSNDEAKRLGNAHHLPLFVTATCDFVPYDDPTKSCLGAYLLLGSANGAIALLTTPRLAFAASNEAMNEGFIKSLLQRDSFFNYPSLGEALRRAKNILHQTHRDIINTRKFSLIGDPALQLAFPKYRVIVDSVNQHVLSAKDTLKASNKYTFSGKVTDQYGVLKNDFDGLVYPKIFDQPQQVKTLGNNPGSIATSFTQQTNILYNGKATVSNGHFAFTFLATKDLVGQSAKGRMSLYAASDLVDASGVDTSFYIGGAAAVVNADIKGPMIKTFLNDFQFINGGVVSDRSLLIVKLFDSSGINTLGTFMGHDIILIIDGQERSRMVLNNFYETELDSYQNGVVSYQLPPLTEGQHRLKIIAWDNNNNKSEVEVDFTVSETTDFKISNLYNYPNPFSNQTTFSFQQSQPGQRLDVAIMIYALNGALVKKISRKILNGAAKIDGIEWRKGDEMNLSSGIYFYQVVVKNALGQIAKATQKMYIF